MHAKQDIFTSWRGEAVTTNRRNDRYCGKGSREPGYGRYGNLLARLAERMFKYWIGGSGKGKIIIYRNCPLSIKRGTVIEGYQFITIKIIRTRISDLKEHGGIEKHYPHPVTYP